MRTNNPSQADIIYALISLGFIAGEETPVSVILSDGNYTLSVPVAFASDKDCQKLCEKLDEIFSYYTLEVQDLIEDEDSENYDANLRRMVSWVHNNHSAHRT